MIIHELKDSLGVVPIERLRNALNAEIAEGKTVRRWSYEIEANELGRVGAELVQLGYEIKSDSSVNERWEDCTCDTCDHDCNCNSCGYDSWDSEKCEESQATEATPTTLTKVLTADDNGRLERATELLKDSGAYVDSSCGGHIHIDAKEMTPQQVGRVMRLWDTIQDKLWMIVGRTYSEAEGYADRVEHYDIEHIERGEETNRCAVNPNNYLRHKNNSGIKNTIEFRQFSGTLDSELIMLRGLLCRRLVEHAEKNLPIYYLLNAQTPEQVLRELNL